MAKIQTIAVTTDASGDATVYSTPVTGRVLGFYHNGALDAGADFTITGEDSLIAILTITNAGAVAAFIYPRGQVHDAANAAALTLDGTRKNVDHVHIKDYERIKIVVAQGGNAQTGSLKVLTDG